MHKTSGQSIDPPRSIIVRLVEKLNQGSVDEVIQIGQTLAKKHHESINVWKLIGSAAFQKNELHLAETALKNVVSLSPNDPAAFANLGKVQHKLGNARDATISFQNPLA